MNEIKNDRRTAPHPSAEVLQNRPPVRPDAPKEAGVGRARSPGRPSVVAPFRLLLGMLLQADPRMKSAEVLQRMRQAGYTGGKSALYEMVRSLRSQDLPPLATFEALPGVISQHDFGAFAIAYTTGRRE